jgi:hypothetical protein
MKHNKVFEQNPGFVDAENLDFTLTKEAGERFKNEIDFIPIPFEKIGCYKDELRASWPVPRRVKPDRPRRHVVDVAYSDSDIDLDGRLAEWKDVPRCPIELDLDGGFLQLLWRDDGLYGAVRAKDGTLDFTPDLPWQSDHLNIYVEPDCARRTRLGPPCIYFTLSIRPDIDTGEACISMWDEQDTAGAWVPEKSLGISPDGIRAAWQSAPFGYTMEFFIPADRMTGATMSNGTVMGFYATLSDDGQAVEEFYAPEFPSTGTPATWGHIRLVK